MLIKCFPCMFGYLSIQIYGFLLMIWWDPARTSGLRRLVSAASSVQDCLQNCGQGKKFANIIEENQGLLSAEGETSFEVMKGVKREKKKKDGKKKKKIIDKTKKERMEEQRKVKRDKKMKKFICREVSHLRGQFFEEIRHLHSYCKEKFDSMVSLINSMSHAPDPTPSTAPTADHEHSISAAAMPSSPNVTLVPPTQLHSSMEQHVASADESTPDSRERKRAFEMLEEECLLKENEFAGRKYLLAGDNELINSTLRHYPTSDSLVFESENIAMSKVGIGDLLREGWLTGTHPVALAIVLNRRRSTSPQSWAAFLSPNYSSRGVRNNESLMNHITAPNVQVTELLVMSVHIDSH